MQLNRRQAAQIEKMKSDAKSLRADGRQDWNDAKAEEQKGNTRYATELRDRALTARADWDRLQDQIDSRTADPSAYRWND
jgi:hypothetical protein